MLGQVITDDIGPRRQGLSELDEGRPHGRKRPGHRRQVRVTLVPQPLERPAEHSRGNAYGTRRIHGLQHRSHRPGAFEGGPGANEPKDVVRPAHLDLPSRMQRRDAHGQVAIPDLLKPGLADHLGK